MGLWLRLNQSKLKLLSHQFKRCYVQPPYALLNYTTKTSKSCASDNPIWDVLRRPSWKRPIDLCNNVRFFATSVQSNTQKDENNSDRLPMNERITANFIRLVTDEGHDVVQTREALKQARSLKLDLVQVTKSDDPPVCKMMDFNKEKYKRQAKKKERAKVKSEVTLRSGDHKEVQFSAKCEQKDLKMKADTAIRLMERGYRVKCTAQSTKKLGKASFKIGYGDKDLTEEEIAERRRQEEEQEKKELNALLSRLIALMGDEFLVESEPRVETKQAYVIVRHVKFGPPKKGGVKKSKDVKKVADARATANHSDQVASSPIVGEDSVESATETKDEILSDEDNLLDENNDDGNTTSSVCSSDDFDNTFSLATDDKDQSVNDREGLSGLSKADSVLLQPKQVLYSKQSDQCPSSPPFSSKSENRDGRQPFLGAENRYKPQNSFGAENRYKPQNSFEAENRYNNEPQPSLGTENSYKPQPSLGTENRYKPQPSPGTENRYKPQPSPENRYKPQSSPGTENRYKPQPSLGTENRYKPQSSPGTENRYKPQPSLGTENRYKRTEPRQQFQPITSRDSMGTNARDASRFEPQFSPQSGRQQAELNTTFSTGASKPVQTDSSAFRNRKLPDEVLKQPSSSHGTGSSLSDFGIFSSPKPGTPGKQGVTSEANINQENRYKSNRDSNRGEIAANPKFRS